MKIEITDLQKDLAKLIASSSVTLLISRIAGTAIKTCLPKNMGIGLRFVYFLGTSVVTAVAINQIAKKSDELIDEEVEALNELFEYFNEVTESGVLEE